MKSFCVAVGLLIVSMGAASSASAQMGMDIFKKSSFSKVFHPVVGAGGQYQTTTTGEKDATPKLMDLYIVGKEPVEGKDGYWMEYVTTDSQGKTIIGKILITKDDFQFHRMIVQMQGHPAMEMPFNPMAQQREKIQDKFEDWHTVGTESITVPAGTFSCEHLRNDKTNSDNWTSDKISPFGVVKEVSPNQTMILVKSLTNTQDRITGPVQKFDPLQMMQQMQQGKPPQQ
jgi:hypothetical protein